jgi:hypothetical protein
MFKYQQEGDGAVKVFTEVRVGSATTEDDDLTPLSWLQDRNLLKGKVNKVNLLYLVGLKLRAVIMKLNC